ncbi:hypothetical protein OSJ77_03605 [Phyllobacterium sp. 0TCS1.6C]|uniref:hypothetical protein n=1 Tax=unclassified Phyllobacterium TaxID=2638441 RepID=UPI0022642A34|nr:MULTISPECIES: hypothetical protein [unclassified Phyllobacterium]MCX8279260.1 hypothetical protein [Phyllobacterium sp. 0TCS1.6C]MCX8294044.1 hypothetical protein [Phyllobacterium sp. 0TCS1.6A]
MGLEQELADFNGKFEASAPSGAAAFLNSKIGKLMIDFPFDRVLKPGDLAPEFRLPGGTGETISLFETLADGPIVLMTEKNNLTFDVLSDIGNVVARKFGLVYKMPDDLKAAYSSFGVDLMVINGDESWELPKPITTSASLQKQLSMH